MCGTSLSQTLHDSLWKDSVIKKHGSTYNAGKGIADSRLRMQAVRKDSKDQQHFNMQHQAGGWKLRSQGLADKYLFGAVFGI